ncbi:MAG: aldo/keto reductase [Desulfobacteraceae bacterium]|nr:MAG: aldo/keto reductase [Desulfobacteraceae bacterium]
MQNLPQAPFGKTGHLSTRIIFGAAAFYAMRQDRADRILELLLEYGVNHIDVAASYGEAELRVGGWMPRYRNHFFIATKTGERTAAGAKESIQRSLERLRIDCLDSIQLHNLTDEEGWQTAQGPGGALEGAIEAREKGWVRFIGVTGHGVRAPQMHLRSLERFDFDSVLLPFNYMMVQDTNYAAALEKLLTVCGQRHIAVQTIKAVARRRWQTGDTERHFSWYEPVKDPGVLRRAVQWVLSRPGLFLNTSSDTTLLPLILEAALTAGQGRLGVSDAQMAADAKDQAMEPLFSEGLSDPF